MKLGNHGPANAKIYLIFRVYNLGSDHTAMRIYLDPETLREGSMLRFTPVSNRVSPGVDH